MTGPLEYSDYTAGSRKRTDKVQRAAVHRLLNLRVPLRLGGVCQASPDWLDYSITLLEVVCRFHVLFVFLIFCLNSPLAKLDICD